MLSQTMFKSRSGRMLSFKDAIDKEGKRRFGKRWLSAVIGVSPTILPYSVYEASADQVSLAVVLLGRQNPPVIVRHHANETDESVPSFLAHSALDLNFSDEQWSLAQKLSEARHDDLVDAHTKLLRLLERFADSAASGRVNTYVRRSDTFKDEELDPHFWEVEDDLLRVRYQTSLLERSCSKAPPRDVQLRDDLTCRSQTKNGYLNIDREHNQIVDMVILVETNLGKKDTGRELKKVEYERKKKS